MISKADLKIDTAEGRRTITRSLCFMLQQVVRKMWPDKVLFIDHSLPSGLYCEVREQEPFEDGTPHIYFLTDEQVGQIRDAMDRMVEKNIPFTSERMDKEEAARLFELNHQPLKAELARSLKKDKIWVHCLDGEHDWMHGDLVESTGLLDTFDLMAFNNGFCLQLPMIGNPHRVMPMVRQSKIADALKEYSDWCGKIEIRGLGALNKALTEGHGIELINLAESLHERKYADIADMIYSKRHAVKVVMIAGPSSSGKTSTSLRIALQLKVLGMKPKVIELDNYFVNRENTPKDENGEYDFESLYAMDLKQLNQDINDLLDGKTVEIPRYDFKTGERRYEGNFLTLGEKDILIMEGIHALNPEMTSAVDASKIFRVYASALTSLNIDENNSIATSDNRCLRRIVRDNRTRGITPDGTLLRWHSVRRGEARNIFPYQENADVIFNSAMIYELPLLAKFGIPLLEAIPEDSPAFHEANRHLRFLRNIVTLTDEEIKAIPPTSIMREFIGGQTL
ncbi:MAG: nucleoside kinase [Bacteroidales bacterium]|nr:nucleoside kinase [Bacteroidales bacterium]